MLGFDKLSKELGANTTLLQTGSGFSETYISTSCHLPIFTSFPFLHLWLSVYQYLNISISLFLQLALSLFLHLYIHQPWSPQVSISSSLHLCISQSFNLSISQCPHLCISPSLHLYFTVSTSLHLSISPSLHSSIAPCPISSTWWHWPCTQMLSLRCHSCALVLQCIWKGMGVWRLKSIFIATRLREGCICGEGRSIMWTGR